MTSSQAASQPGSSTATPAPKEEPRSGGWWERLDVWVERAGERLNPILVKESRQALKSKQFIITFSLLLVCGWVWSLLGVALLSPGVYFAPGGRFMLVGYFVVLAVPVLVMVPFSAYLSLASEQEEGTFELLSITTLSARQIVTGKLASATIQIMVFYSALAPCIAFTYLLRGVDIPTILLVLVSTFGASLLLSSVSLVIGALTRARHWQVVLAVILIASLLVFTLTWCIMFASLIGAGEYIPFDSWDFWAVALTIFSIGASFLALFVFLAAAQISFASDNRSTRIRVVLLAQQLLWVGWMVYFWLHFNGDDDLLYFFIIMAAMYWMAVGSLVIGETAQLSPRVRRTLPQSFLGRTMLTWFNPGSGTGYAFVTVNLISVALLAFVADGVGTINGFSSMDADWYLFTLLAVAYITAYLGFARLVVLVTRRVFPVGVFLSFILTVLLVVLGAAVPALVQTWQNGYEQMRYTIFQSTNWFWTLGECLEGNFMVISAGVPFVVTGFAMILFLLNLLLARLEVEQVRQETPARVLADDNATRDEAK